MPDRLLSRSSISSMLMPALRDEVEDHGGVDVAGARPHDEAFERRQAHRGVDGLAVQHRRG